MANLVIPAGTALVGYALGGPVGAQIGWMVGSAYAASKQEVRQQSVGDLRIQTASYGTAIPIVVGKQRVAGNLIWSSEKIPYEIRNRVGKGGPTSISTGYKINCLIGICAGPIAGISRVWADGELIIDSSSEAKPLIGQLYLGDMAQNPDPTYESAVGAGNAPAYRGLAYIALSNYDLGVQGRIPNFSFEVIKGATL